MNRILRRPMFRKGGSTSGITSGLRTGYESGLGVSSPEFAAKMERLRNKDTKQPIDYGNVLERLNIPGALKAAKEIGYKPRGTNVYDFMTEMGLDLVSRPAAGNIFQQVATSAKGPYDKWMERKGRASEQQYASEADMFKTLIGAQADIIGSEKDAKSYAHRDRAEMIRENMNKQYKIYDQLENLDPDDLEYEEQRKNLLEELRTLKELVSGDEFAKAQLQYWNKDENSRKLDRLIRKEIGKLLGVDPETSFVENREFAEAFIKRRNEIMDDIRLGLSPTFNFAKGGRVGYQMGQSVMGNAVPAAVTAMPTAATTQTMPEELGRITYEELRARLPQEIGDEIVRLLANSAEALEDFATIQTEQDIANFNKKYGVNLVLPSEG